MNMFSPMIMTSLTILKILIIATMENIYKSQIYPSYVKTAIPHAFVTILILAIMFIHTGQETMISN